jgi:ATP-dependent RNA helicase DeaD
VNSRRLAKFKARIGEAVAAGPAEFYRKAVQEVALETDSDLLTIAAALASLVEGNAPLTGKQVPDYAGDFPPARDRDRDRDRDSGRDSADAGSFAFEDDGQQVIYRLDVGKRHGALPGNIVGAIANEAKLQGSQINGVDIRADHSFVKLPANLPANVIDRLSKVQIRGQALNLQVSKAPPAQERSKPHRKGRKD